MMLGLTNRNNSDETPTTKACARQQVESNKQPKLIANNYKGTCVCASTQLHLFSLVLTRPIMEVRRGHF